MCQPNKSRATPKEHGFVFVTDSKTAHMTSMSKDASHFTSYVITRLTEPSTIAIAPLLYTAAQSPLKEYYTMNVNTIEHSRTTAQKATETSQFLGASDYIS